MQASKRVTLNTAILYGRMLLTMGITLYSTRLVLLALGSKDYGIFNLIAGIIAMLSFLNAAMTTSTQRFLSYYQAKEDLSVQKRIFTNSLLLHILIGFIIVIGLEFTGLFLFSGFLRIPPDRVHVAVILYHFMSATVFFTIVTVPFTATLNAHENMIWVVAINVWEAVLKLGSAFIVFKILTDNKLISYGVMTEGITMISFFLYLTICITKYKECSLKFWKNVDRPLLKELSSFAGWNLFGSICVLGKNQGIAVMLNVFFGTVINAAYGIANQIAAQLNFLSVTLMQAINPQIMKSQGAGDNERMLRLSMIASKFSFFLMAIVSIPCIFEMRYILTVWLKNVPDNTVVFCDLILLSTLINQLTVGLQSSIQSTGNIKHYQIVVGTVILLNLPIAYVLLKMHFPAYTVIITFSVIEALACVLRLYFAKKTANLVIKEYVLRVFNKEWPALIISVLFCFAFTHYVYFNFRFLATGILSSVIFSVSVYFIGLYPDEKDLIKRMASSIKAKIGK